MTNICVEILVTVGAVQVHVVGLWGTCRQAQIQSVQEFRDPHRPVCTALNYTILCCTKLRVTEVNYTLLQYTYLHYTTLYCTEVY